MHFCYSYKTKDGAQHEGNIVADKRDDVYTVLIKRGIHPMKVWEDEVANRRMRRIRCWIAAAIFAVIGIAAVVGFCCHHHKVKSRYRDQTRAEFTKLQERAHNLRQQHDEALAQINIDHLRDYAALEKAPDDSTFIDELERARIVVASSRRLVKDLFANIFEIFPPESVNERIDAQKLYDDLMTAIDATEDRLNSDEYTLDFLAENKGKWKVEDGKVKFSEKRLEKEFRFLCRDAESGTSRWKRDFGGAAVESAPVEVPADLLRKKRVSSSAIPTLDDSSNEDE